jgi:hypothetical protein
MPNIDEIIEKTVKSAIIELKKHHMIKDQQTPYQKAETLLYNYRAIQETIIEKHLQIETIKTEGVPQKSCSISSFTSGGSFEVKAESEKAEDMIKAIENSIRITTKFMNILEAALISLHEDPYYEIISMIYFEKMTREDVADFFQCDVKTVTRNKSRLINILQIKLFSDEFIYQIFN